MNTSQASELMFNSNLKPLLYEDIQRRNQNQTSQQAKRKSWSMEEDLILRKGIKTYGTNWMKVAQLLEHRNPSQCAQRWKRIKPEAPPKRDFWTPEEDELLQKYALIYQKKWVQIAKHIPNRTSKQVRDRYVNKLNPEINQSPFTDEEDKLIAEAYLQFGSKWSRIVKFLKGRPENIVKNRFYTYIGKHYLNIENPYYVIQHNKNLQLPKEEYDSVQNSPSTSKGIKKFQKLQFKKMKKMRKQAQIQKKIRSQDPKLECESNNDDKELLDKCKIEQEHINISQQIQTVPTKQDPQIVQKEEEIQPKMIQTSYGYPQSIFYNLPIPMLIHTDKEFKIVYMYQTYNDPQFILPHISEQQQIQYQNVKEVRSVYSSLEQQTLQRDD